MKQPKSVHKIRQTHSTDIATVTYTYTACGKSGDEEPSVDECTEFYTQANSLVFLDNQVGDFGKDYEGAQRFQVRKTGLYDITVAGAAGGRGLCNTKSGHGAVVKVRVQLEAGQEAMILVGQKGVGPCDTNLQHQLCQIPPNDRNERNQCSSDWNGILVKSFNSSADLVNSTQGGAAGGGASMVWLRQSDGFAEQPLVVGGGGGGTPSVFPDPSTFDLVRGLLQFDSMNDSDNDMYQRFLNGKHSHYDKDTEGIQGTTGLRFVLNSTISGAGAGGGWINGGITSPTDGQSLSHDIRFAEGGHPCAVAEEFEIFEDVEGGFGGGGGGCGGGGGGGGYTGGTVFSGISFAGSGGYSYVQDSIEIVSVSSNNIGNGYIDIVPADCGCAGSCVITGDQFECTCPEGTSLAFDNNDCYNCECLL